MAVRLSLGIKDNKTKIAEGIKSIEGLSVISSEIKGYLVEAEGDFKKITEEIKKIEGVIILSILHLT
ncbi:MAG TPA: hypothetical protein PLB52_00455 [Candidatus Moranbacteria bacterium]|nr:hypothetical protein [Candidatus Moranbacteria bacterium]